MKSGTSLSMITEKDTLGEEREDEKAPLLTSVHIQKPNDPPQPTPLPWMKLMLMSMVQFCEAFNGNSIFAYLGFMIVHFGLVKDVASAGLYSGFVGSSFFFSQFLTSFLWGRYSDVRGRRTILLIGLFGSMLSCILFGFSPNIAVAIVARSLNGLINGNLPVAKTYLGEVTDKTNQAQSYTIFAMSWGIGIVLGPVFGGILAMPITKYHWWPHWLMRSTLEEFPFLLPNLATALFYFVTFVMCFFYMTETVQKKSQTTSTNVFKSVYTSFMSILTARTAILSCVFFAIHCFMVIVFVEVFPLWAITPHSQQGLNFGSNQVGLILSIGGVFGVLMQILTFKRLAARFSYKQILKYSVLIMAILMVLLVEVERLYNHRALFWIALAFCICFNQQLMLGTFSGFNIVMNNSVPFTLMGSMNGVAMSLAALGRTIGPTLGSNLYAWTVNESLGYVISFRSVFYLVAILYTVNIICTTKFLPETVNVPYAVSHPPNANTSPTIARK